MRSRHFLPALFLAIPLSLLGVACGDDTIEQGTAAPPTSDPSGSVSSPPPGNSDGTVPGGGAAAIRSRTDLIDARAFEPESVSSDPANNQRLLIRFWGGVEPCYGVEVRVVETTSEVKVTVLGGTPPEAQGKSCIALAKLYQATADLQSPLGSRTIVVMK
ncbi:MAG TPA: hypothetical protein VM282_09840 [Acidimicrobiales bacterium]|nr:hypothetical protein [Acidimicrobiales bacterium]